MYDEEIITDNDNHCKICDDLVGENDDVVRCFGGCRSVLHVGCTKLTKSSLKVYRECKNIQFACDDCVVCLNPVCQSFKNEMKNILATVADQLAEIKCVKESVEKLTGELKNVIREDVNTVVRENIGSILSSDKNEYLKKIIDGASFIKDELKVIVENELKESITKKKSKWVLNKKTRTVSASSLQIGKHRLEETDIEVGDVQAAFLVPIINTLMTERFDMNVGRPHVVVVSPTRELAIQIYHEARKFSRGTILKICIAYGGTASRNQGENIAKGCHILVATPGRLLDYVEKAMVTFEDIKFVVLDEADRMLDMGFLPSVEKIMNHETMVKKSERQTLMFSATFPRDIQELAGQFLTNYIFVAIGIVGGASADVDQQIFQVSKFEKRKKLEEILSESDPKGTLVFVETKRNADYLASLLSETKYPTTSIHGDRLQREREEALRDFKSGHMFILIATDVAARGLDIKNVAHVVNYDLPKTIDSYVHRIGRTGRVGNKGKASSFYNPETDSALAGDLVKILTQADQKVPDFLDTSAGGSYGSAKTFGASDIRNTGSSNAQPTQQEPEEDW